MLDAKAEVDARLRQSINDFTGQFVARMTSPIDTKAGKKVPLQEAPARTAKVRQNVEKDVSFLRFKLSEYISDARTREMLVQAVMESVTQAYEDWYDAAYSPTNGARSSKGKGREDGVWDPDVFGEWACGVFKVGVLRANDEGSASSESDDDGSTSSMGAVSGRGGSRVTGSRTGLRIEM